MLTRGLEWTEKSAVLTRDDLSCLSNMRIGLFCSEISCLKAIFQNVLEIKVPMSEKQIYVFLSLYFNSGDFLHQSSAHTTKKNQLMHPVT